MKLPTTLTPVAFSSRPIEIVRLVIVSITVHDLINRSRMTEAEGPRTSMPSLGSSVSLMDAFDQKHHRK